MTRVNVNKDAARDVGKYALTLPIINIKLVEWWLNYPRNDKRL